MPDQPEQFDRLGRYWDAVVRGEAAAAGDLDPALVKTLKRFQHLGTSPPPPGARERVWRTVAAGGQPRANRTEFDMDGTYRLNASRRGLGDNGHRGSSNLAAPAPWWWSGPRRVGLQIAAAILLFLLGVGYAWFGPDRRTAEQPIAILAPESSDETPAVAPVIGDGETLLDVTLTDVPAFEAEGGIAVTTYPPDGQSRELAGVESPEVFYIASGPMTMRVEQAPQPVRVIAPPGRDANAADAYLDAGQTMELATGTTVVAPAGAIVELTNPGPNAASMMDLLWASDSYSTEAVGTRWDRRWGARALEVSAPVSIELRRLTLAAGDRLPSGASFAALDAANQRYLRPQDDGGVRNTGPRPIDLYVLAVGSAADGTPTARPRLESLWRSAGGPDPAVDVFGIAAAPDGNVWVSDARDRFQIFAPDGTFVETWGTAGSGDGEFAFRSDKTVWTRAFGDVGFDAAGNIYVADTGNFRVQKFAPDRTFLAAWGGEGEGDGQFIAPTSLAVGPDGTIYVSDESRSDIQRFDADGNFLGAFGSYGSGDGQFAVPAGVAVAGNGDVWVADYSNQRIQHFDADGNWIASWGDLGTEDGRLASPNDVAVDAAGRVYVADEGNGRLQVFDEDGRFLAKIGDAGAVVDRFAMPVGVAVGPDGTAYVADMSQVRAVRLVEP